MSKYSSWGERELIAELEKRDAEKKRAELSFKDDETRLFYVVDSLETNEEIFETYSKACDLYNQLCNEHADWKPRMYIAEVKNSYWDGHQVCWNYEDLSDTFSIIQFK